MAYDKNAAIKKHQDFINLQNQYLRRRYFRKVLPIVMILAAIVIGYYSYHQDFHDEKTILITVSIIVVIVSLMLYPFASGWLLGSNLYYKINGSTDAQGNHRCIRCQPLPLTAKRYRRSL